MLTFHKHAVMMLIENSVEAISSEDGAISISTGKIELSSEDIDRSIHADRVREGAFVALAVTDNGAGIDPETQARIFEPFFSTKFTGRGLGLAAVFGIMKGHQGAIMVKSRPGKGTSITLCFPSGEE